MQPTEPKAQPIVLPVSPAASLSSTTPNRFINSSKFRWLVDHKLWLMIAGGAVVVIAIGIFAYAKLHKPKPKPKSAPAVIKKVEPPKPKVSPLTGLPATDAVLAQPVFGVVIENSPEARPQSSLSQAGVVYETLAEGGITRFLAIYLDQQPTNIGPVRSLRPYFIDWAQEYSNAPVAHAGGSSEALALVPQVGLRSMNGLIYGSAFRRAGDRFAPHNLYTSTASLIGLMQKLGFMTQANFASWLYKGDQPEPTPSHPTINIGFSYPLFGVKYQFNAGCDCYDRFLAGTSHIDRNSGAQIKVKNVVTIVVQTAYDAKGHALDTTVGSGKAYVFRDGGAVVGTWTKASRASRIQFLDATGKPIPLNAGNTWVEAIAQTGTVSF